MELVKIAITGKGDKRPFAYPLLQVAKDAAKTCVITDDPAFKRLYSGHNDSGEIEGVKIRVIPSVHQVPAEEELAALEKAEGSAVKDGCDCILYVLDSYVPAGVAKTIAVVTQVRTFLGWETDEYLEEHPKTSFVCMSEHPGETEKSVKVSMFAWDVPLFLYLIHTEERRKFSVFKDKAIGTFLSAELADTLNVTEACFKQKLTGQKWKRKK